MIVPVSTVATPGLIKDLPPHRLPLGAWTSVKNIRFGDGFASAGYAQRTIFNPTELPLFLSSARGDNLLWVMASAKKVFAFDEISFSDITRDSGPYTGGEFDFWNGKMFNGFYVLNNGVDVPQSWNLIEKSTLLVDLPAWQPNVRAKVIRPFGAFLIALDVTKSVRDQRLVKWSHSADPNTLPSSWDETDASKDAGEVSLAEGKDAMMDCLPLLASNVVYSELQTWRMAYIGPPNIFGFFLVFPSSGILAQGCVQDFKNSHFVVTQDDIVVHNLNTIQSVADASIRRWFFSNLDGDNYLMTRVVKLLDEREMWVCFPTNGSALTHALVWNWNYNTWSIQELGVAKCVTDSYSAPSSTPDPWSTNDYTWNGETTQVWGGGFKAFKYTEALLLGTEGAIYHIGDGNAGTVSVSLERTGIINVDPEAVDELSYKQVLSLRPSISAPEGTVIQISVGHQDAVSQTVIWDDSVAFMVGADIEVALNATGRYLAVKFEWTADKDTKLYGFYLDVVNLGERL
jgi:hypothetical protein